MTPGGLKLGMSETSPPPQLPPLRVGDPVPGAWKGRPGGRRDDPEVMGSPAETIEPGEAELGRGRKLAYGAAAFGSLFAAGWALSKTWGSR